LYGATNNMRNIFLVSGSEKTMDQFLKTGSVAESELWDWGGTLSFRQSPLRPLLSL